MIKRKRLMFFIGALLLTLAITLGLFAYGATTATVTLGVSQEDDFVTVTVAGSPPTWTTWGSYTGRIPSGDLFTVTPNAGWTGDMSVILRIANAEDLIECYGILVFEIRIRDSTTEPLQVGTTEYLGLGKGGQIYIDFEQTGHIAPYTVEVMGGYYVTHSGGGTSGKQNPTIYCQVLQRSAP